MDPNLPLWQTESQPFFDRVRMWFNLLDPSLLLASDAEIVKAHTALLSSEGKLDKKEDPAVTLCLSSVHTDSGEVLPLVFRAPAFLPIAGPVIVAALLPHSTVKPALFWQFLLQSYNAGFSHVNRNSSAEQVSRTSPNHLLLIAGTVSYASVAAALPQILMNRLNIRSLLVQTVCKSVLPIPLSALLAFLNVFTVRSEETETGIRVFDYRGNHVGMSKAAGQKAVRETALSRAALFGTAAVVPNLLVFLLQRRVFFKNPLYVLMSASVNISHMRFLSQDQIFPEKLHAGGALPFRQHCSCLRPDDSSLLQRLSSARNDKKGKSGGRVSSWSDRHQTFLPQRIVELLHDKNFIQLWTNTKYELLTRNCFIFEGRTAVTVITKSICIYDTAIKQNQRRKHQIDLDIC